MTDQIEIKTQRLSLRSITPKIIHALFNEKTEAEIRRFFDTDDSGYNHLKDMHERGMETHRISLFYFLIVEQEQGKIIGDCGFHTWNRSHRRAELFYNLRYDTDKRKGIMSEAVAKVLDFGFTTLELHRVEALTATSNIASIKLLERFKFTREGIMREDYVVEGRNEDSECFSLLKWEWEQYENNSDRP